MGRSWWEDTFRNDYHQSVLSTSRCCFQIISEPDPRGRSRGELHVVNFQPASILYNCYICLPTYIHVIVSYLCMVSLHLHSSVFLNYCWHVIIYIFTITLPGGSQFHIDGTITEEAYRLSNLKNDSHFLLPNPLFVTKRLDSFKFSSSGCHLYIMATAFTFQPFCN